MNWSKYQTEIFDAVSQTDDNLAINAVAGSGKTTTLVEIGKRLPHDSKKLFLAFNTHIADELSYRLPQFECRTTHALGRKLLISQRRVRLDNKKSFNIIMELSRDISWLNKYQRYSFAALTSRVMDIGRSTLTNFKDEYSVYDMINTFGLNRRIHDFSDVTKRDFDEIAEATASIARKSLRFGYQMYKEDGIIDYADMLYLPVILKLTSDYDVVLVDEVQDLNAAQLQLVKQVSANGRVIAVGDERQSIMAFSGSMANSFETVVETFNMRELPLSISYRCPTSHIKLAQKLVPHIEARPDAPEGMIEHVSTEFLIENATPDDLIISRTNGELVKTAIDFLSNGIPVSVRGRDFSSEIIKIVKQIDKMKGIKMTTFANTFKMKTIAYGEHRKAEMMEEGTATDQLIEFIDQIFCIKAMVDFLQPNDIDELNESFKDLFVDDDEVSKITLSSVHRTKGLEANRVFIVKPNGLQIKFDGQQPWEKLQEENTEYVALTRSKDILYMVHRKDDDDDSN